MSVIGFDNRAIIGVLAATWASGSIGSRDGQEQLQRLAKLGNLIATANHAAYVETYDACEQEPPITADEIKFAIVRLTVNDRLEGFRNLRSLRYNLVANNGRDFAMIEILDGLVDLYDAALTLQSLAVSR